MWEETEAVLGSLLEMEKLGQRTTLGQLIKSKALRDVRHVEFKRNQGSTL